jgi:hypothetical protein
LESLGKTEPPFQTGANGTFEYARLLGVRVLQVPTRCEGVLSRVGDRFIIRIRQDAPPNRKSFTVCHEIGHIQIIRYVEKVLAEGDRNLEDCPIGVRAEETLANRIAANLLMPTAVFQSHASALQPTLDSLFKLAECFRTSLTSTAIRVAELQVWPCVLLWSLPNTYLGNRLGVEVLRCASSQGQPNQFHGQRHAWVHFDNIHKSSERCCRIDSLLTLRDCEGKASIWRCESIPEQYKDVNGVFSIFSRQESG